MVSMKIAIKSMGCARPVHQVAEWGSKSRATVMPPAYVAMTKNIAPWQDLPKGEFPLTALTAEAATRALQKAGIGGESISLIVGETATAEQTIPGISHRVGKALGIKCYCYDQFAGAVSIFTHLYQLQQHRQPINAALLVAGNGHTTRVAYDQPSAAAEHLEDASSAMVVTVQSEVDQDQAWVEKVLVGQWRLPVATSRYETWRFSDDLWQQGKKLEQTLMESTSATAVIGVMHEVLERGKAFAGSPTVVELLDVQLGKIAKGDTLAIICADHLLIVRNGARS